MARAVKEEPDEGRRKKKKTGVGTMLNRLLIVGLMGGCAYLYGQTVHLQDELNQDRTMLTATGPRQTRFSSETGKPVAGTRPAAGRRDYLALAQAHTQRAEQALSSGNVGDAWRESTAASDAARAASLEASAQTQKSLTQIRGRLDSVQERASKLWHNVGG